MGRSGCSHRVRESHFFGRFLELAVFLTRHGLADPVGDCSGREREAEIVHRLIDFGSDVMCAILIAYDRDKPDFAEGRHAVFLV